MYHVIIFESRYARLTTIRKRPVVFIGAIDLVARHAEYLLNWLPGTLHIEKDKDHTTWLVSKHFGKIAQLFTDVTLVSMN